MSGGTEFLFWGLVFALVIGAGVAAEWRARRKRPRSLWLKEFDEREHKA